MFDPRGSLWRRWDLHVHTPASGLNQAFNCDWDTYVKQLITKAHQKRIAAVGITDYFSIEGYRTLRTYFDDMDRLRQLLETEIHTTPGLWDFAKTLYLIPNIELRLSNLVPTKADGKTRRINLHVLFSDTVDLQDIDENFLGRLEFLSEGAPSARDETKTLTRSNIEKLGRRLKVEQGFVESDYTVGCTHISVNHEHVTELLESQRRTFGGRYVLALADEDVQRVSWDGQGHLTRKLLYQKSHFIFSANPSTRAHFLTDAFETEFGNKTACIWGSDAHTLNRLFEVDLNRQCWIKADRSFSGLLQVANEPADRVFTGNEPPTTASIREKRRVFVKQLDIGKADTSLDEPWFDGTSIAFNPELVAIVGRKGGGKSALADIIALLGQSKAPSNYFSFLNESRFLKSDVPGGPSLASHFQATLTWNNGSVAGPATLAEKVAPDRLERIKYLPQGYIERICTGRDGTARSELAAELNRVIFANIGPEDRGAHEDLDSLLDDETSEIKRRLSRLKGEVRRLNLEIVQLEERTSQDARLRLLNQIRAKTEDVIALEKSEPAPVLEPAVDPKAVATTTAALREMRNAQERVRVLDGEIRTARLALTAAKTHSSALAKLSQRLDEVEAAFRGLVRDFGESAITAGIDLENVVTLRVDRTKIHEAMAAKDREAVALNSRLAPTQPGSLTFDRAEADKQAQAAQAALDEPSRRHQAYLAERAAWERQKTEVTGDADTPGTLHYFEKQLSDIDLVLPSELRLLLERRDQATRDVYSAVSALMDVYRRYYSRIQEAFLEQSDHARVGLQFRVAISADSLQDRFFGMVTQSVTGTFCGVDEGRERLSALVQNYDFGSEDGALRFVHHVLSALKSDMRYEPAQVNTVARQMRKGVEAKQLLDYLFSLEFLEPRYELLLDGRSVHELSPGERGLLLLYFYLAIDRDTTPLILDQPDENLDNESIKDTLVPLIRRAKQRRQIFVVTHNPNLAVVCDAEQIIYARMEKSSKRLVTYEAGSIENPTLNKHVVNVLEGTPPAFRNRQRKYITGGAIRG